MCSAPVSFKELPTSRWTGWKCKFPVQKKAKDKKEGQENPPRTFLHFRYREDFGIDSRTASSLGTYQCNWSHTHSQKYNVPRTVKSQHYHCDIAYSWPITHRSRLLSRTSCRGITMNIVWIEFVPREKAYTRKNVTHMERFQQYRGSIGVLQAGKWPVPVRESIDDQHQKNYRRRVAKFGSRHPAEHCYTFSLCLLTVYSTLDVVFAAWGWVDDHVDRGYMHTVHVTMCLCVVHTQRPCSCMHISRKWEVRRPAGMNELGTPCTSRIDHFLNMTQGICMKLLIQRLYPYRQEHSKSSKTNG